MYHDESEFNRLIHHFNDCLFSDSSWTIQNLCAVIQKTGIIVLHPKELHDIIQRKEGSLVCQNKSISTFPWWMQMRIINEIVQCRKSTTKDRQLQIPKTFQLPDNSEWSVTRNVCTASKTHLAYYATQPIKHNEIVSVYARIFKYNMGH